MCICRFIGGLYGRIIGRTMVAIFGVQPPGSQWAWIDPGVFALIGAASFFGGVSRLTVSLTVIMVKSNKSLTLISAKLYSVSI